jgi:hypothetical protein
MRLANKAPAQARMNVALALSKAVNQNFKIGDKTMRNEYTTTEVIEIGEAQDLILGQKGFDSSDTIEPKLNPDSDFDE